MNFDLDKITAEVNSMAAREWHAPTLADLPNLGDWRDDENVLFAENFLARGQSMALVGSSGTGKSSMNIQECYHWAAGKTFLATPKRPLKIAIIQTEDSPRDIDDQRKGMRNGLVNLNGWDSEDIIKAEKNIIMPSDFLGLQGDAFINMLREFQGDMKLDLISINPLQGVFGDDLSDQKAASHFCRAGLDPIMKDPHNGCCIQIVMHTPKQKSGNKDGRAAIDDYAEYAMAGSQEWTAWCRAVFTFLKHGKTQGVFDLACPKRGHKLGWMFPTRVFKFSPPEIGIFWQEVTDSAELKALEDKAANAPDEKLVNEAVAAIIADLKHDRAYTRSTFTRGEIVIKGFSRGILRAAGSRIVNNPQQFRLKEKSILCGKNWTSFIGYTEGLKAEGKRRGQQALIDDMNQQEDKAASTTAIVESAPPQPTPQPTIETRPEMLPPSSIDLDDLPAFDGLPF